MNPKDQNTLPNRNKSLLLFEISDLQSAGKHMKQQAKAQIYALQ